MDDLVLWLRTQLDVDQQIAEAATPGPWWHNPGKQWLGPKAFETYDLRQGEEFVGYGGPHPFTGAVASTGPASDMQGMKDAAHIAEHHPARVLQEVESKRRVLGRILNHAAVMGWDEVHGDVLRSLALPYQHRRGYQQEWRP